MTNTCLLPEQIEDMFEQPQKPQMTETTN